MTELDQLKKRINNSKAHGIETAIIREDYEPIGDNLLQDLCDSGQYIQRKIQMSHMEYKWKIFAKVS